jgi:antitoxin ParD1/3/4
MTVHLSPKMETLVRQQIESGAFATAEEVVERALESWAHEDDWISQNREEVAAMIEEGWESAQRGELLDEEAVRAEMQKFKEEWLKQRRSA